MNYSTELKAYVVGMREAGRKVKEIASECNLPEASVYSICRRHKLSGTVVTPQKPGRPPVLNERDVRHLARVAKSQRRATLHEITNGTLPKVNPRTIRKALASAGLHSRIAAKKPFLSEKHKAARLTFAKKYLSWSLEDWKRVIWCDESTFEIGKNSRQIRVWRMAGERHHLDCLAPTFKSGRSSLMLWGAIAYDQRSELAFMDPGKRTAGDYVEIVYRGPLLDMLPKIVGPILMEDGAPIHRSKTPKEWQQRKGLEKLDWLANHLILIQLKICGSR